jgi:membrane fusion protein, multidrug efflux system
MAMNTSVEEIKFKDEQPQVAPPKTGKPSSWRKRAPLVIGGVIIAAAISAGASLWFSGEVSTDDAQVDGHLVTISPKISGHVVEVLVNDNQQVKAGDVLARIDDRDFKARVDQARASLQQAMAEARSAGVTVPLTRNTTTAATATATAQVAAAEAEFVRAQAAVEQARQSDIAYADANIATKRASNDRAQSDLSRMKPLADKGEISQQQYDAYMAAALESQGELRAAEERRISAAKQAEIQQASLAAAKARVDQARANVDQSTASEKQVDVRSADLGNSLAKVEAAKANLDFAQLQFSYAELKAPVDGVVTRKTVELGQLVQPGQGLLVLVPLNDVWVTANFKETQLAGVRPGQPVEVKVDTYGRKIIGHVDSIAGATGSRLSILPPENATGNFVKVVQRIPVKVALNPSDLQQYPLRVGMNAEVTIQVK